MYEIPDLLLQIAFCENRLKVIYPLLNNEEYIFKIEELYINFPEETQEDITEMEYMKRFFRYENFIEEELKIEIDKLIEAIKRFKRKIEFLS